MNKDISSFIPKDSGLSLPSLDSIFASTPEEQMQFVSSARQLSSAAQIAIGKVLSNVKENITHGQFLPLLSEHGWNSRSAQRYMKFAEFADFVGTINPEAIARLDMSRWTLVQQQLDQHTLTRFIEGEEVCGLTLAEAEEKGSRELKLAFEEHKKSTDAELIAAKKKIGQLKADVEIAKNHLAAAKAEASRSFSELPFSPWVVAVREEATVHGDTCNRSLAGLALALEQVRKHMATSLSQDQKAEYVNAANVVYHQIIAAFNQTKLLLEQAHSFLSDDEIAHFDVSLPLSETELAARLEHVERLQLNEQALEQIRAKNRRANKKASAGRPTDKAPVYED